MKPGTAQLLRSRPQLNSVSVNWTSFRYGRAVGQCSSSRPNRLQINSRRRTRPPHTVLPSPFFAVPKVGLAWQGLCTGRAEPAAGWRAPCQPDPDFGSARKVPCPAQLTSAESGKNYHVEKWAENRSNHAHGGLLVGDVDLSTGAVAEWRAVAL
jgi:hypothetical protein